MGLRPREYAGSNAKQVKFKFFYYVHVCLVPGAYCNIGDIDRRSCRNKPVVAAMEAK